MADSTDDDRASGRATVREVYQLVGEVRDDLGGRIDDLRDDLAKVVNMQEHRLTVVETVTLQHTGTLTEHETRITGLESAHQRALGHLSAWKLAGGVFGGAATIVIADLVFKAFGG